MYACLYCAHVYKHRPPDPDGGHSLHFLGWDSATLRWRNLGCSPLVSFNFFGTDSRRLDSLRYIGDKKEPVLPTQRRARDVPGKPLA